MCKVYLACTKGNKINGYEKHKIYCLQIQDFPIDEDKKKIININEIHV